MYVMIKKEINKPGVIPAWMIDEIKKEFNIPDGAILQTYKYELVNLNEPYLHTLVFHWEA